ncbi:MAG: aminodeoxychorismate synthase component I [Sphingomonadales bacterium]
MTLIAPASPFCLFEDSRAGPKQNVFGSAGLLLQNPIRSIIAKDLADVIPSLTAVETAAADGYYVAGCISYEGAPAFDAKMAVQVAPSAGPLLKFQLFKDAQTLSASELNDFWRQYALTYPNASTSILEADISADVYEARVAQIKTHLEKGDIYQANFTFPLSVNASGHAATLYARLRRQQPSMFSAFLSTENGTVLSLSPERFFSRKGKRLYAEPMKGTLRNAEGHTQDDLRTDPKNRAENLMIVDLLRNDMSRVAKTGSVEVPALFDVQSLPSVFQMTSRIEAELQDGTSLSDIFTALFPCGSITGAPKIRAMDIIAAQEAAPRGLYCGAIGIVLPSGDASFSVPIRTLISEGDKTVLNVGSGIVADSNAADEYAECLAKADFLTDSFEDFALIETAAVNPGEAPLPKLWELHLDRLERSSAALGFTAPSRQALTQQVRDFADHLPQKLHRLRLVYGRNGSVSLSTRPADAAKPLRVRLGELTQETIPDRFLRHKTSMRWFYAQALTHAKRQGPCDEVFLVDEDGLLTEGSFTNIFLESGAELLTPKANNKFLPGILREHLLRSGDAKEAHLTQNDLYNAKRVFAGNALRGLVPVQLL